MNERNYVADGYDADGNPRPWQEVEVLKYYVNGAVKIKYITTGEITTCSANCLRDVKEH